MQWEKPVPPEPKMVLTAYGIRINNPARQLLTDISGSGYKKKFLIGYDPSTRTFGFKPSDNDDDGYAVFKSAYEYRAAGPALLKRLGAVVQQNEHMTDIHIKDGVLYVKRPT